MLPGMLLAAGLGLGNSRLERCTHGCCLGLALAIYLASVASHFNLRFFYPAWLIVGLVSLFVFLKGKAAGESEDRWMMVVLLLVAVSRFAVALPQIVPKDVDPPVLLVIAEKIQMTQPSVHDWLPFDSAQLNYPAGAPTLLAVMSSICRLPLYAVHKDLMALLGVLCAAQIALFTRRVTGDSRAGLYAAFAYSMWAGVGSIELYEWGYLPLELGMLMFIATLSAWLEEARWPIRLGAASILYTGTILSNHHAQLASEVALVLTFAYMLTRSNYRQATLLISAMLIAAVLDAFFLVPYAAKIAIVGKTNVLHSEAPLSLAWFVQRIGYAYLLTAVVGLDFYLRRAIRFHPVAICSCIAMIAMFIACEYVLPPWLSPRGRPSTVLAPSHFLNELVFLLAPLVGGAISLMQKRLRLNAGAVLAGMLVVSCSQLELWTEEVTPEGLTPDYIQACQWIRGNTSADTIVLEADWGMYLSWRRGPRFRLPVSERQDQREPLERRIAMIISGAAPPDSPEMKIVQIDPYGTSHLPALWRSASSLAVVRVWPK